MKKTKINIPSTLGEGEKIEYLKVSAEFWKNYFLDLDKISKERSLRSGRDDGKEFGEDC